MDKIAEHIAKFNAPEDAVFCWVSFTKGKIEKYINELYLECLMLKVDSENWVWLSNKGKFNKLSCNWPYALKHEQKGEQMKSIELSDEELKGFIEYIKVVISFDGSANKGKYLNILKNAKPIPTEPRWSEDGIYLNRKQCEVLKREMEGCDLNAIDFDIYQDIENLVNDFITPKPRLRDRNHSEVIEWLKQQNHFRFFQFSIDERGVIFRDALQYVLFQDEPYPYYRIDQDSPWLPIPPIEIEIESEK